MKSRRSPLRSPPRAPGAAGAGPRPFLGWPSKSSGNPGIFARLRSFAANILRFNGAENIADMRYRITLGGIDALRSMRFM